MRAKSERLFLALRLAVFFIMTAFVMACGENNPTPTPPEPGPGPENGDHQVVVLDQKERPTVSDVKPDGTVVFDGTDMARKLAVGTVICSEPTENAPHGFLYKVTSVKTEGDKTVVTTEQACLEDAIEKCHVAETIDLTDKITGITFGDGSVARFNNSKDTRVEANVGVKIPVKLKVKNDRVFFSVSAEDLSEDAEVELPDNTDDGGNVIDYVGDEVKASGNVSIAAEIGLTLEVKLSLGIELDVLDWSVKHFALWAEPELKIDAEAALVLEGKMEFKDIEIGKLIVPDVTVMAGAVPVVISPGIRLYADVTASGKIKVKTKLISMDFKYKVGIDYTQNEWTKINENTSKEPSFFKLDENFKATLEGELKIVPTRVAVSPGLYHVDTAGNLYAGVDVPFKIKVEDINLGDIFSDYYVNPKIKATWGVSPSVKAKLTVLKHDLVDFNPTFNLVEVVLFERYLFPKLTDLTLTETSSTYVSTAFSLTDLKESYIRRFLGIGVCYSEVNGGDNSLQMFGEGNRYVSIGGNELYWEYDREGDIDISLLVEDLKPNTNYYIRPYFSTLLGTKYGHIVQFNTSVNTLRVQTRPVTDITSTTATLNASVESRGTTVLEHGFCISSRNSVPTKENSELPVCLASSGSSSCSVRGLTPETKYYVRAFATNALGTVYGNVVEFTTLSEGGVVPPPPDDTYILYDPHPVDGATDVDLNVLLSCSGHLYDYGENNFEVRISKNPDMSSVLQRVRHTGPSVNWVSFNLEYGTTYYWQVSEFDFDKGDWVIVSPVWHFTTRKDFTPEPKLSVSPKRVDFGSQIKFTQKTADVTITNSGTGTLQISSISKTSNYGDLFRLSGWTSGGSIAAGASKTVTVSFQPMEERYYEETLTIVSSNSVSDQKVTVTLCGTGAPEPEDAVIQISDDELQWGDVEVGESVPKSFTVKNTGTTALSISSIKVVATDNTVNPSYFVVTPDGSCTISPGKSKAFTVAFIPEAVRSYSAMLSIKSNAGNATQGTSTIWLSGSGIKATSKVLSASPSSLSFGYQTLGNRTHRNFTVTNTGTKAVTLYSMVATDGFIVDQTWADGYSLGLAAGASKTFSAYFAPTQVKSYSGQITIKSNASSGDLIIPLSGIGEEAQGYLEITSGESLDFGNVNIGTSGTLYSRIRNTGEAPLRILGITCPEGFTANCTASSINDGYNASISVSFTPTQAKTYRGTIIVNTDAENESVSIDVSGTGIKSSTGNTFVDMGLSVKWASANVGASNPEEFGHYVAWAETRTKTQYLYNNYQYYYADYYFSENGFIKKYCSDPSQGYQGYYDLRKMLTYDDDYAQAKLGGLARIPTRKEWEELKNKNNCSWSWTTQNGVYGYLVTSLINGNSIFLPAGGLIDYSNDEVNSVGYYWTSNLNHESTYADTWELRPDNAWYSYRERYKGLTVRAVEDYTAKPMIDTDLYGLSFEAVKLGTTASKTITVRNIGKGTLHISDVRATGLSVEWTSATIEPGASRKLTVSYTPKRNPNLVIDDPDTWYQTTLTISSDARNASDYIMYVKGYGVGNGGNIEGTEEDPWN